MTVFGLSLRWLRTALIVFVVVDLLVLATFALRVSTTTTHAVTPLAQTTPSSVSPTTPIPAASSPLPVIAPAPVPAPIEVVTAAGPSASVPAGPTPTAPGGPSAPSNPTAPTLAACPIPLKEPAQSGGLQSLIDFSPAFGPFSAEAFAAASAYQPALQLIGPILAQYPALAPKVGPFVTPLVQALGNLLNSVYGLIAPYYSPIRAKVLEDETKLANVLAPYGQTLGNSPLGGCVVDLEAALVGDTKPSPSS